MRHREHHAVRALQEVVANKSFTVTVDLHLGGADYKVYTTDLSTRYVELNMGE